VGGDWGSVSQARVPPGPEDDRTAAIAAPPRATGSASRLRPSSSESKPMAVASGRNAAEITRCSPRAARHSVAALRRASRRHAPDPRSTTSPDSRATGAPAAGAFLRLRRGRRRPAGRHERRAGTAIAGRSPKAPGSTRRRPGLRTGSGPPTTSRRPPTQTHPTSRPAVRPSRWVCGEQLPVRLLAPKARHGPRGSVA
jgi:hypothetical protein